MYSRVPNTRHCHEKGLIKTIQTIPHNLFVSFKLASLPCLLKLILEVLSCTYSVRLRSISYEWVNWKTLLWDRETRKKGSFAVAM